MNLEDLFNWNDKLMHAPAGIVVGLFAIVLGYILKSSDFFPNKFIPLVIVAFTTIMFPVIQWCADASGGNSKAAFAIPVNLTLGFIVGGLAWLLHAQILRRFVDPKFFPNQRDQRDAGPSDENQRDAGPDYENKKQ